MPRFPLLSLSLLPISLSAQIIRVPQSGTEPVAWVSVAVGALQSNAMSDHQSSSIWIFARPALYLSGSVEKAYKHGASLGVLGSYTPYRLDYQQLATATGESAPTECVEPAVCRARATSWSAMLFGQVGGGPGLYYVLEAGVGATGYRSFTESGTKEILPPSGGATDGVILFGSGVGYGSSPTTKLTLAIDYMTTWHKPAAGVNDRSMHEMYVYKLGVRQALGRKKAGL